MKVVIWYNLLSINVCESQRNLSVLQHIKTHSKHQKPDLQKYSADSHKKPLCAMKYFFTFVLLDKCKFCFKDSIKPERNNKH